MDEDIRIREELKTVQDAVARLVAEPSLDSPGPRDYENLVSQYRRLLAHAQGLTRIGDFMRNQLDLVNEQLHEAVRFQTRLLSTTASGILAVDADRIVTRVNNAFSSLTGYHEEDLVGKSFNELVFFPSGVGQGEALTWSPLVSVEGKECTLKAKDGRVLTLLANAAPLEDSSGRAVGGIVSFTDVTELIRAREAAKEADQTRSSFLARMGRDIRAPVNAILGFAEMLGERDHSHEQLDVLEAITERCETLLRLIDDIVNLSKIEAHKQELDSVPVSLAELVREATELVKPAAVGKNLPVRCDIGKIPDKVMGDPVRIKQILTTVLSHAVKFTDSGEIVTSLGTIGETPDKVNISIRVRATGVSTKDGWLEPIFDLFSRIDSPQTGEYRGTGLGLAICRQLTDLMNGRISVQSEPWVGSTFEVNLWLEKAPTVMAAIPGADPKESDRQPVRSLSVLVVEDEPINLKMVALTLSKMGHKVDVAYDGREAVDKAKAGNYDAIFMDLQLPEIDGLEATRILRRGGVTVPIIAMTGMAMKGDRELCLEAGMTDHVPKPIQRDQITQVLHIYCR
jgi:PAS domain S-box-containing protein